MFSFEAVPEASPGKEGRPAETETRSPKVTMDDVFSAFDTCAGMVGTKEALAVLMQYSEAEDIEIVMALFDRAIEATPWPEDQAEETEEGE
jgi:hypothetical protein